MREFLHYLALSYLLQGALVTLEVTGGALAVGLAGGVILAAVQAGRVPGLPAVVRIFVLLTRGTPILLQLLFVYDVLPTVGVTITAATTAVIVLGLNTSTFFSEILRGSVTSLDRGQVNAARSLGMTPWTIARKVIGPQAIRIALPQLANQTVVLILTSSLASTISVAELTLRSQTLSSSSFQVIPVYAASGLMYLVMTSAVSVIQVGMERSLDLDRVREAPGMTGRIQRLWLRLLRRAAPDIPPAAEQDVTPGGERDGGILSLERYAGQGEARPVPGAPMLSVRGISKRYGQAHVLKGVDLEVGTGEIVVLVGASGCGKSTLLRAIAQLEDADAGTVFIAGEPFGADASGRRLKGRKLARARARARVAMVFQNFELFRHMTAEDNVAIAPRMVLGLDEASARENALGLLTAVGLGAHARKLPRHLSGGQQQRTAIARALAMSPRIILLDEPTSALDPEMVHEVLTVLRQLAVAGITMVIVTHEMKFAMEVADRLLFMADGRVVESGRPADVLLSPSSDPARKFFQKLGLWEPGKTPGNAGAIADNA